MNDFPEPDHQPAVIHLLNLISLSKKITQYDEGWSVVCINSKEQSLILMLKFFTVKKLEDDLSKQTLDCKNFPVLYCHNNVYKNLDCKIIPWQSVIGSLEILLVLVSNSATNRSDHKWHLNDWNRNKYARIYLTWMSFLEMPDGDRGFTCRF